MQEALGYDMDATVTNFAKLRQLWAAGLRQVLVLALSLGSALSAQAKQILPGQNQLDFIYVQAPALNSANSYLQQPVIAPRQIGQGEWDHIGHLWPRAISYSMETDSVEAFVQSDLRVGMQYNYSFNFELSARNGQGRGMAIPEGWYQLQVAVIKKSGVGLRTKSSGNPFERYVTSNSMFLKVSNGSFGRKISLRFPDITQTSLKHHLFVELIPLKEDCEEAGVKIRCINVNARGEPDAKNSILEPREGYKTYLVEMPFMPFQPSGGKVRDAEDLSENDQAFLGGSLATYIARAQLFKNKAALQAREVVTPADHARKTRLNLKSLNDPDLKNAYPGIKKIFETPAYGVLQLQEKEPEFFTNLCEQLVKYQTEFQDRHRRLAFRTARENVIRTQVRWCTQDPQNYMRLNRVLHVGRPISGKIERIDQKSLTYTLMANYMSSRSQSIDTFTSVNIKTPTFLAQFLDQIGLGFGHSVSYGTGRSRAETGIASMSTSLDFNYVIFDLPTVGSQQCLEVRALNDNYDFFFDRTAEAKNGLYICDEKSTEVVATQEVYAHAFERCRDTTMMECDRLAQSVNQSLRGEGELSAFFYAIRDGISPDHNNRVMPFGTMANAQRYFANTPVADDMQVVTPIEFASEKVPSFLKLISGQHREFRSPAVVGARRI